MATAEQTSVEPRNANRSRRPRNPLAGTTFFHVPVELFSSGVICHITASALKRYLTLLRLGNYMFGKPIMIASQAELEKFDGVSERAAWLAIRKLKEWGMIKFHRSRPFGYILLQPQSWRPPTSAKRVFIKRCNPLLVAHEGNEMNGEREIPTPRSK